MVKWCFYIMIALLSFAYGSELVKARKITFQCPEKPVLYRKADDKVIQRLANGNFLAIYVTKDPISRIGIFDANGKFIKNIYFKSRGSDKAYFAELISHNANGFSVLNLFENKKMYDFDMDGNEIAHRMLAEDFMYRVSHAKYGNKYYVGGLGEVTSNFIPEEYDAMRYAVCIDIENHTVKPIISFSDKKQIARIREINAPFDRANVDIRLTTGMVAIARTIAPDIWIFDAKTDSQLAHFTDVPKHFVSSPPGVLFGHDIQRWHNSCTFTNVPFWLNDSLLAVGRSIGWSDDTVHVDIYTVTRGLIESIRADKQYIFADNDTLYFLDSVDTVNNTFTLEARTVKW